MQADSTPEQASCSVKDADIANYTSFTATQLENVASQSVKELHYLAVETIEKKFCFNITVLQQTLNLSLLNVINYQWPLFVPPIVATAIKCRADKLGVTVSQLAELLNTTSATLHGYDLNGLENNSQHLITWLHVETSSRLKHSLLLFLEVLIGSLKLWPIMPIG